MSGDDLLGPDPVGDWLDDAGDAPPGDFADVLRRAQALPGARVSDQDIEEAEALPADEDELRARLAFGTLDDFLDDAAAWVADQGAEDPPAMRAIEATEPRSSGLRWAVAGLLMAAAALALWFVLPEGILGTQDAPSTPAAAADRSDPTPSQKTTAQPQPTTARDVPRAHEAAEADEAMRGEPENSADAVPDEAATGGPSDPTPTKPKRSLAELDTLAREAWRAGELKRARRLFERVVARGGRGERADIAYGDLFTLARRQGDTAGLRRYWKRYSKRFPGGRYIDDARAGLCRAARGDAQAACWQAYLKARPRGTYRADAEAALHTP